MEHEDKQKHVVCLQLWHYVCQKWAEGRAWKEEATPGTNQRGEDKEGGGAQEASGMFNILYINIIR